LFAAGKTSCGAVFLPRGIEDRQGREVGGILLVLRLGVGLGSSSS